MVLTFNLDVSCLLWSRITLMKWEPLKEARNKLKFWFHHAMMKNHPICWHANCWYAILVSILSLQDLTNLESFLNIQATRPLLCSLNCEFQALNCMTLGYLNRSVHPYFNVKKVRLNAKKHWVGAQFSTTSEKSDLSCPDCHKKWYLDHFCLQCEHTLNDVAFFN